MEKSDGGAPLAFVFGEDEFSVKQRAQQIFVAWRDALGGFDEEIIDAQAGHSSDALAALGRLREALQTLPFFGGTKRIWFKNCNFLGEERAAGSQAVVDQLNELVEELKTFDWSSVRLLIGAGKVDQRKTFFRTLSKIAAVESFAGWSVEDADWTLEAQRVARAQLRSLGKEIAPQTLTFLVEQIGPNPRQLNSEIEKLALYLGARQQAEADDIRAVITRNKQAGAFELAEAFGDRDLGRALKALDEALWELRTSSQSSEIGLLYGLISKVRTLIFLKELLERGWVKAGRNYARFKEQWEQLPPDQFAPDRRFNPSQMSPYPFFKALDQARKFEKSELIEAMELLLKCNERLIFSGLEGALILQQTMVKVISGANSGERAPQRARMNGRT